MSDVTKDQRRIAKAVNFGIVYGMSPWGLAEELNISTFEANDFINRYFMIYPEVKAYLDNVVKETKEIGYTETIFGRRRYMPEINSSNGALRQFAERTAKNAPIQGAAADVIKLAMVAVDKKFKELGLKSKLITQVHDELVVDTINSEVEIVKKLLKEIMEGVVKLDVLLEAELSWGTNWDMK
jgi:DNA polymerase-1